MYSHMMVGSNDLEKSKTFYDAVFTAIGGAPGTYDPKGRLVYAHKGSAFLVTKPINGEPACISNGSTIGFAMDNPEQADAWHAAGAAAGGTEIEDAPGVRDMHGTKLYLAYLRDPDGHKLCALYRMD
ncbi:VOC family protein [Aurantiacibacter xanthus]|uniref:VOC family protein n=1 Tax=Aurantiacibacter xanthus TaxID=1784712 RepID=A0A3A1P3X9_9SPHN|nr:VOC family protein [Aurantiacibacter xanthus]RIV82995.1 VOC family protein [Aurantiacibacter xanthus]